jgi:hypothetical protein
MYITARNGFGMGEYKRRFRMMGNKKIGIHAVP